MEDWKYEDADDEASGEEAENGTGEAPEKESTTKHPGNITLGEDDSGEKALDTSGAKEVPENSAQSVKSTKSAASPTISKEGKSKDAKKKNFNRLMAFQSDLVETLGMPKSRLMLEEEEKLKARFSTATFVNMMMSGEVQEEEDHEETFKDEGEQGDEDSGEAIEDTRPGSQENHDEDKLDYSNKDSALFEKRPEKDDDSQRGIEEAEGDGDRQVSVTEPAAEAAGHAHAFPTVRARLAKYWAKDRDGNSILVLRPKLKEKRD